MIIENRLFLLSPLKSPSEALTIIFTTREKRKIGCPYVTLYVTALAMK